MWFSEGMIRVRVALLWLGVSALTACQASEQLSNSPVGAAAYDSTEVQCKDDSTCAKGEACTNGICQMKRCNASKYTSRSPLGAVGYFRRDDELVVAGDSTVEGYEPEDRAFIRPNDASWQAGSNVVDVAGGNFLGSRPEAFVYATTGSGTLTLKSTGAAAGTISLGWAPVAVAAGDVDGDEIDEVFAVSESGNVAWCNAKTGVCTAASATPQATTATGALEIVDIAAGDVDGDGYVEAVLATTRDSLIVVNFDTAKTGQAEAIEYVTDKALTRIAAGDLNGDGLSEVVGVYDGWTGDELRVFSLKEAPPTSGILLPKSTVATSNGALDLAIGMFGGREKPEVALLREDGEVEMFAADFEAKLASEYTGLLSSKKATRLAIADVNGDSPSRRMVGEPTVVPGSVVPVAVLSLPPYSRTYSNGKSSASMGSGTEERKAKYTGSVFTVGAGISAEHEFAELVEASVSVSYSRSVWRDKWSETRISSEASFSVEANPELEGFGSGAVILGCGCYHRYEYTLDDPAHKLGKDANGKTFALFVPVEASTTVIGTARYAALVEALGGNLPKITIPYQLGQVASYPEKPMTLDGNVIRAEDMVFTKPPTFRVSDVAETNFELSVSHEETEDTATWDAVTGEASLGVFGVAATGLAEVNTASGYGVGLAETSTFSGTLPSVKNDPTTPEDELKLYGYSVTPYVYRHHYKNPGGDGSYFVLTYSVGK